MEHGAIIKHDLAKGPKTGDWRYMKPEIDKKKCIGCMSCVGFCPDATIEIKNKKAEIDYEYCKGCGVCAATCPKGGIVVLGFTRKQLEAQVDAALML